MEFFYNRTRVRLWSREYGAYVRADEVGEIILHCDPGILNEARAAHCLVRDANHCDLFRGAASDRNLVQIVDGDSPGGRETNHAVQCTKDDAQEQAFRAEEQRQRQATQAAALAVAATEPAPAMDSFPDRTHVWLRIRDYGRGYLYAREDGEGIAFSDTRGELHGAWAVHRLVRDDTDYVLLQSASYGRYLALGEDGDDKDEDEDEDEDVSYYLPAQCTYDSPEQVVVLFEAKRAEDGSDDTSIGNFTFGDWCRADNEDTPLRWEVQAIPQRLLPPELPVPPISILIQLDPIDGPVVPGYRRLQLQPPQVVLRRRINYVWANDQGNFNPLQWRFLYQFDGRSVFNLRRDIADELGEANVFGITLCVRAGSSGRLTPLVIDLPRNEETMNIVILTTGSPDTDDIYEILPSRIPLHGIASRISDKDIDGMRDFLLLAGDEYFLNVFESCLEPINGQVQEQNSYVEFIGTPLQQTVSGTCAILSSIKCVEIQHRREYETYYGPGTFPCQAAAPRKLRTLCRREKIWTEEDGAYVGSVMGIIKRMGGVKTTNAPPPAPYFLPLHSWEQHTCDELTPNRVMELLDSRGPSVGSLWVCPWYHLFDAVENENLAYRSGCARSRLLQHWSDSCFEKYKVPVGLHSVVCFAYRVVGGELYVRILDNHTTTGPERWVHYTELQEIHTVSVKKLDPPVHLGGRYIVYPKSSS